ncbi:MAG: OsmC family protein [Bacteroidales bacterium]|nr:OsmC family protein [Bacteroidales bacterium]
MAESVNIRLKGEMAFDIEIDGHHLMIDSAPEFGGENRGPKPKNLMLASIGGCTGMDVVSMLRKMRVPFDDLRIEVSGNITEEHPRHFDTIHIIYIIKGLNIPRDKVETAVNLSQEKYCGVTYSLRQSASITHEIIIEE